MLDNDEQLSLLARKRALDMIMSALCPIRILQAIDAIETSGVIKVLA